MSTVFAASIRICLRRLGLLGIIALALVTALGRSGPPRETTTLPPAHNPERLHLLADAVKVVGWISGTKDHAAATVTITAPACANASR